MGSQWLKRKRFHQGNNNWQFQQRRNSQYYDENVTKIKRRRKFEECMMKRRQLIQKCCAVLNYQNQLANCHEYNQNETSIVHYEMPVSAENCCLLGTDTAFDSDGGDDDNGVSRNSVPYRLCLLPNNNASDNFRRAPHLEVSLKEPVIDLLVNEFEKLYFDQSKGPEKVDQQRKRPSKVDPLLADETGQEKDKGEYIGTDDGEGNGESFNTNSDGLGDIWNEMSVVLHSLKDQTTEDVQLDEHKPGNGPDCEHLFILKDDIGYVCRICGFISRGIETIIEYNFSKNARRTRTYRYERRTTTGELDQADYFPQGFKLTSGVLDTAEFHPHPRHGKVMKPHQVEGFKFLLSNLVTAHPGGCIMAHAPGSGKTFMIISFLQTFMAKYPAARPLVVLPKGILEVWKKEFMRWQVEDMPLYDLYSVRAKSRAQQLHVLKQWEKERSVLFLGYAQFSSILCDTGDEKEATACQKYLREVPTILILDEGHTPRNKDTDILTSLQRVETPRKVVLSGTLYQNHVKEVFNILNLVRPRFLNMETPKRIKRRILRRAQISGSKNTNLTYVREDKFYDLIEDTLTKDKSHTRKKAVIEDLREMTRSVLHYYKGDNLDELPGLVDFSVFLRLSPKQKKQVKVLANLNKFTFKPLGSAIYVHPVLKSLMENSEAKERVDHKKIDALLENFDANEGVKASFYLNLLNLCESGEEKLLVFSQYLLPLKFLERMTAKLKGYAVGREMFMITGDSDAEKREFAVEKFNTSSEARVFFGSIKACGEGISLVGASRIIILDVHPNPSVTRQAIGRAFRPGQVKKVYTYRLIASESPEENDQVTCYIKDSIAKQWFESDHIMCQKEVETDKVDVGQCGDVFLETARLNENVVALYKR